VSSFGISGTNAHVILEQAPDLDSAEVVAEPGPEADGAVPGVVADGVEPVAVSAGVVMGADGVERWPLVLSARSEGALREVATRLAAGWPAEVGVGEVAASLAGRRALLERRAVVWAADVREAVVRLSEFEAVAGRAVAGKVGWLFTGQGSQWPGMGLDLEQHDPVFAEAFAAACAAVDEHLPVPIREALVDPQLVGQTLYTQAGLFVVAAGLVGVLRDWDVPADVVAGHSIGEIVAAWVAGVFDLADAARLVTARGALMQALPAGGGMVALAASSEQAEALIEGVGVDMAAVNAPQSVVVAGADEQLAQVIERAKAAGVKAIRLDTSHAFHSRLMDPMLDEFRQVAESLTYHAPQLPVVSNVTGQLVTDELTDPAYWVQHVRQPVRFADAITAAREAGVSTFIEVGPEAVLTTLARHTLPDDEGITYVPLLRKTGSQLAEAKAALHVTGTRIGWNLLIPGRHLDLPTYPFQRQRYWLEAEYSPVRTGTGHPFLTSELTTANGATTILTGRITTSAAPWLADARVAGATVLPSAAVLDLAWHAAAATGYDSVAELLVTTPLRVPDGGADVQLEIDTATGALAIHARSANGSEWTTHATGRLGPCAAAVSGPVSWPPPGAHPLDPDEIYARLAELGHHPGPAMQNILAAWQTDGTHGAVFAELAAEQAGGHRGLHPAQLDGLCQLLVLDAETGPGHAALGSAWHDVQVNGAAETDSLRLSFTSAGLHVADANGRTVVTAAAVEVTSVPFDMQVTTEPAVRATRRRPDLAAELTGLDDDDRAALLLSVVRDHVAEVLGHADPGAVDPDAPYSGQGFDSLAAVELRNRLSRRTGLTLPSTLVFDYPTARRTAAWLDSRLRGDGIDGDTGALLGELARLEGLFGTASADQRAGAAQRLETLLQQWQQPREPVAALDDATDDELFAALDAELSGN
jgi:acyl transferase domain-containing protein